MASVSALIRTFLGVTLILQVHAAPVPELEVAGRAPVDKRQLTAYAPHSATCPSTPLVRSATGISSGESAYISARQPVATTALGTWLQKVNSGFSTSNLPSVGLTTSGGGLRSLLEGAGVIQAFDSRDSNYGTSGLYQGLVYEAGLSGGGWLLSSLAGNNWPTISSLQTGLWESAFQDSLLDPGGLEVPIDDAEITADLIAKDVAGFPVTLTDPWGRLLSYQLLYGDDGGVADTLSGLTGLSAFTSHSVPYPIITSIEVPYGQCIPAMSNPQFEMHPYEWGSWDSGIAAFTQTAYLGTSLTDGVPTDPGSCIENYDNLGYILGTSSNLFSEACISAPSPNSTDPVIAALEEFLTALDAGTFRDEFAVYPNPFYQYTGSPLVSSEPELYLVDGGLSQQNNPIWPFIQPARANDVSVLIVNDNSADTSDNYPDGSEIYNTYVQAQSRGLTRMPVIPPSSTFVSEGLNKHATFFGCNSTDTLTIIYLPNVNYTYDSGQSTERLQYSSSDTDAMIANGNAIGTQNNDPNWPTCLGCGIVKKTGDTLPSACTACFTKYCYN